MIFGSMCSKLKSSFPVGIGYSRLDIHGIGYSRLDIHHTSYRIYLKQKSGGGGGGFWFMFKQST